MTARRVTLLAVAASLTALDLAQKAASTEYEHDRSPGYVLLAALLGVAVIAVVPRVPSTPLAAAGGVAAAGALGNGLSALVWGGVPNPLVAGAVAFNVADVCAVVGAGALVAGASVFGLRHPQLLRERL